MQQIWINLQSQYGVVPIASIARVESGMVTYTVGGGVVARANNTSLQSYSDLKERKVCL